MAKFEKGHPWYGSEESMAKIIAFNKTRIGIPRTEEEKRKISEGNKGKKRSETTRKNISLATTGRKQSPETIKKRFESRKGYRHSPETILKMKLTKELKRNGEPRKYDYNRKCPEYLTWRDSVFRRDNWLCQKCFVKGGKLEAHHIENFSSKEDLRFNVDNGITFCKHHHREFHKMYGIKKNNLDQVNEFKSIECDY